MKVPADAAGKTWKCVRCGERIRITQEGVAPPSRQPGASDAEQTESGGSQSQIRRASDILIGQLLIKDGLINQQQLDEALDMQGERGGRTLENLLDLKYVSKEKLHAFLSKQSGVPSINLKNYGIPKEVIALVPKEFAQENVVLPIDKLGGLLTVGMACPLDKAAIADLKRITGLKVKAMLCQWDDIFAAIRRYYPSDGEMPQDSPQLAGLFASTRERATAPREDVPERIARLDALAALPETLSQLRQTAENAISDIAEIVGADPPVAARLLSVANSPVYGIPGEVTSIGVAATLVGPEGIATIAARVEQVQEVAPSAQFDCESFRHRSVFCAKAARLIAEASGRGDPAEAYAAGLLCGLGELALATVLPGDYVRVANDALGGSERIEAETGVFGIAYPEAGHILAREWKLPGQLAGTIRFHRDLARVDGETALPQTGTDKDLLFVVALAAIIADAFERDGTGAAISLDQTPHLLTHLRLNKKDIEKVLAKTAAALRSSP